MMSVSLKFTLLVMIFNERAGSCVCVAVQTESFMFYMFNQRLTPSTRRYRVVLKHIEEMLKAMMTLFLRGML